MKFQIKMVTVAVAAATLAGGASAAAIDFHGYARSGVGSASKGGSMVCYGNVGSMGHYRLGNECDTYLELALDSNLAEKRGTEFKLHTMIAAGTQQLNDWEQTSPAWRQAWVEATNIGRGPFATANAWVGKRYYKRQDIHMLDYFYNEVTGPGAGIENIDAGFAKFSYAYMRQGGDLNWDGTKYVVKDSSGSSTGDTVTIPAPYGFSPDYANGGNKSSTNHDFRLEGIQIAGGDAGSVDVMANLVRPSNRSGVQGKGGYALTAQYTLGVLGGFNRVHFSFAKDGASLSHGAKWWADNTYKYTGMQVMDHLVFSSGKFNGSAVVGFQSEKDVPWYNGTTRKEMTVGFRPWYHIDDLYSIGGEVGHINVKPENNGKTQILNKVTVAGQLSAGMDYWSRPVLRLYYTYAKWNDALKGSNVTCTGRDCKTLADGFANATNGSTYGLQFEAWW
ncbi:maltoporin [Uliginosibacterium gangwonense]|uniref:maltoporin n=1 Tax=Uliginosibacterium gangwonense TaxID=392736 RepID=UPI00036CB1FA|nr:carbohydrate porin [Uliginosibacterium gangwonense]